MEGGHTLRPLRDTDHHSGELLDFSRTVKGPGQLGFPFRICSAADFGVYHVLSVSGFITLRFRLKPEVA